MHRFAPHFASPASSPIRALFPYLARPGMISFAGGYPSASLLDAQGLAAATERVARLGTKALQYGATEGEPALRESLATLSAGRGIAVTGDLDLMVTSGSQQGLDLAVRVFVQPGDVVLIESPAYPAAIQALRLAGARLQEIAMDEDGVDTAALARVLEAAPAFDRPKLLYCVPNFSNPRGSLLSPARRAEVIGLARRHGIVVIEDDPYGELTFGASVPEPLIALAAKSSQEANPVVYLSSLSKTVSPALRVGWMIASREIIRRCTIAKQTADLCTSAITQLIAAEYLDAGRYPGAVASARAEYGRRAVAMSGGLRDALGDRIRFSPPLGGMFLWAEFTREADAQHLLEAAVEQGVLFVPGSAFFAGSPGAASMRLSFAAPSIPEIQEGIQRLARAVQLRTTSQSS